MNVFSIFSRKNSSTEVAEAGTFLLSPEAAAAKQAERDARWANRRTAVAEVATTTVKVGFDATKLAIAGFTLALAFTPVVAPAALTLAVGGAVGEMAVGSTLTMLTVTLRGRAVVGAIFAARVVLVAGAYKIGGKVAGGVVRVALGVTLLCGAATYAAAKEVTEPTQSPEPTSFKNRVMGRLDQMSKDLNEKAKHETACQA